MEKFSLESSNDYRENSSQENLDKSLKLLFKETSKISPLSREQEIVLAKEIEKGDKEARDKLITANQGLVVVVAKKYMGCGLDFFDLVQEGNIGLMKAVDKFDHKRSCKLSTYATWWIHQSIERALADQSRTIRIPPDKAEMIKNIHKTSNLLTQEFKKHPSIEEIAQKMELPEEKIVELLEMDQKPISTEILVNTKKGPWLGDFDDLIEDKQAESPLKEPAPFEKIAVIIEETLGRLKLKYTPKEFKKAERDFKIFLKYIKDGSLATAKEYSLTQKGVRFIRDKCIELIKKELEKPKSSPKKTS
ncbi:MAG: sigma-70 family RNA polymerase sigma factor [bacterium]